MKIETYSETIKQLKSAILASRYRAAALANRELLALYFNVGKLIDEKIKQGKWGDKVLDQLSNDLQKELPGLKGFSATNIKRMRLFYQEWNGLLTISPTVSDKLPKKTIENNPSNSLVISQLPIAPISPLLTDQLQNSIRPLLTDQFIQYFLSVSFSHHYDLLVKTKTPV